MAADESCESGECGGTDAPFGPALAAMPDTRIYTKTADAFNTDDVPGDMEADESCESGECGGTDAPFDPALAEMRKARCADATPASTPKPQTPSTRKMFPATWQQTNPPNPANECRGTDAPFDPALAVMLKARCADAFNMEDVPGDMAADESCESGE